MLRNFRLLVAAGFLAAALPIAAPATAHCDGIDGPVVAAARQALEAGNPNPVLIWVQQDDEGAVREALREAIAVRQLGPEAREMADRYFFETLVRLHRAGEGAPYTGLHAAGRDLGPAIPLADRAVATGSDREIADFISDEAAKGVHERFEDLRRKRRFDPGDIGAGREYVASYVAFIHFVEGLHRATSSKAQGHYPDAPEGAQEDHER